MKKIYVASSWRNEYYDNVCTTLIAHGHQIWNWRQPPTGGNGFKWQDCDPQMMGDYKHGDKVSPGVWRALLRTRPAQQGFAADLAGMYWCDVGVLLHPCGRSAHLEAGVLAGWGKRVHVLALEDVEPDLMVLLFNGSILDNVRRLISVLEQE